MFKDGFERVLHFTKSKIYKFYPEHILVKSDSKWMENERKRKNKGKRYVTNGSGMNMSKSVCPEMVRPSNVITTSTPVIAVLAENAILHLKRYVA